MWYEIFTPCLIAATRPSRPDGPARAANSSGRGFEIFAAVRVRMHITLGPRSPARRPRHHRKAICSPSYPRLSASSAVPVVVNLCNPRAAVNSAAGSVRAGNKRNCKKVAPDFHHGAVLTHTPRPYICVICGWSSPAVSPRRGGTMERSRTFICRRGSAQIQPSRGTFVVFVSNAPGIALRLHAGLVSCAHAGYQ